MRETKAHSVAIIIAAYNAQATIGRAVASALAHGEVSEVFVVDDASHDATLAAAQAADDGTGRLTLLRLQVNAGPSVARNRALALSTADWVGVLDADDFFLPGRITALLEHSGDADLIADDMWQVSAQDIDGPRRGLLSTPLDAPLAITFGCFVSSSVGNGRTRAELSFIKPLMRRALLNKHRVRYQKQMRLGEDFELYARLLGHGARLLLVPNRGYVSVIRQDSLSALHSVDDLQQLRDCHATLDHDLNLTRHERVALVRHRRSIDRRLQWRRMIEAVKDRQLQTALTCFGSSWSASAYLVEQLSVQTVLRLRYGSRRARQITDTKLKA